MYKIIVKENDKYAILELSNNMIYANTIYCDSRKCKSIEEVLADLQYEQALSVYEAKSALGKLFSSKPRRS